MYESVVTLVDKGSVPKGSVGVVETQVFRTGICFSGGRHGFYEKNEFAPDPIEHAKFNVGETVKFVKKYSTDFFYGGSCLTKKPNFGDIGTITYSCRCMITVALDSQSWNFHPDELEIEVKPVPYVKHIKQDYQSISRLDRFRFGDKVYCSGKYHIFLRRSVFGKALIVDCKGNQKLVDISELSLLKDEKAGAPATSTIKVTECDRRDPQMSKVSTQIDQEALDQGKKKAVESLVEGRVSGFADDTKRYLNILSTIADYARSAKKFAEVLKISAAEQRKLVGNEAIDAIESIIIKSK
jgi:hypothetical protein